MIEDSGVPLKNILVILSVVSLLAVVVAYFLWVAGRSVDIEMMIMGGGPSRWSELQQEFYYRRVDKDLNSNSAVWRLAYERGNKDLLEYLGELADLIYLDCPIDDWALMGLAIKWNINPDIAWRHAEKLGLLWE